MDKTRDKQLYKLWNRLSSGSYFPPPVKEVEIKKKDGGKRKLGIPTILGRIAQEVVLAQLDKYVEPRFHKNSYGYRKGRSQHQAIREATKQALRYKWAIDIDIKGYFDTIDHGLLLQAVSHYCDNKMRTAKVVKGRGTDNNRQDYRHTPRGCHQSPAIQYISPCSI